MISGIERSTWVIFSTGWPSVMALLISCPRKKVGMVAWVKMGEDGDGSVRIASDEV